MNAVEIESAVSELADQPFDAAEFPYLLLAAYDNKETTLAKLRSGSTNKSDVKNGVLQRNNIHILVTDPGKVEAGLISLKLSPATAKYKCEYVLATDGVLFQAEHLPSGELIVCEYRQFPDHFGFFLPLAGISTVKAIRESSFDIKAIGRLNRLYMELLRENPEWKEGNLRHEMNRFLVRLVFCFYAEDTNIFGESHLFSETVEMLTGRGTENTHEVIAEVFRAMSLSAEDRKLAPPLPRWASQFPYVNGGLFSDAGAVPKFSRVARSYLVQIGNLDWQQVNPDIFGSMIQGVANDAERSNLGMHYTSVPNILKVLNPLFLDDLRQAFEDAKGSPRKLLNLKTRLAHIRVFDPACGSGNFLLIAYKQLRELEHQINVERGEPNAASVIPITNFRGIELQDFAAEVARLSLVIAEFQCNSLYYGSTIAASCFLPLAKKNWIICGNALRLNWMDVCPPGGFGVKLTADDLFSTPLDQPEIDFENVGGETYICGNPPYVGPSKQKCDQRSDMECLFSGVIKNWRSLDYVSSWFYLASRYVSKGNSAFSFVCTNSISQGRHVEILWPKLLIEGNEIFFAYPSIKWSNLASKNAGVTCSIIGIKQKPRSKIIFDVGNDIEDGSVRSQVVRNISPYLSNQVSVLVQKSKKPISDDCNPMVIGNYPRDGGNLLFPATDIYKIVDNRDLARKWTRRFVGSNELINGMNRLCLWVPPVDYDKAIEYDAIKSRINSVVSFRKKSTKSGTRKMAETPFKMEGDRITMDDTLVVPSVSSESRPYLPCAYVPSESVIASTCFAFFGGSNFYEFALISSKLHYVWICAVCGRLETRIRYSNTLGWNTFPIPKLTTQNKGDLTRAAERILETRERHFPATIAELYDGDNMPEDLRQAHEWNDEVVESIFIGRKFKNDSERLERLYDMYAKLIAQKEGDARNTKKGLKK